MSSAGLAELDGLLGEVDLAAIADSIGSVVPDTMSFELALDTPRGRTVVRRWASDSHEGFNALREWLTLAAEAAIATHAPSGSRAPDAWLPPSHESRAARVPEPAPMPRVGGLTLGDVLPLSQWLTGSASPTTTAIGPQLRVFSHVVPAATPMRCVSLVTDGLRRLGRDELILTVPEQILTPDAEHVPATLLKLIAAGLEQGPRLGPGAIIKARTASLPGWSRVCGFALERAWPMDNVTLPPGCLSLHALVGQELAAVDRFGTLRVLARLGLANRFYPTPPWCDPARAPVGAPEESTILASVATAHFPGVTVTREAPWIVLRVARSTQPALAADVGSLDPAAPLALFTSLHLDADACLAWRSGQTAAEANTRGASPASRLAGCFVLFRPGQAVDGGNLLEDGFAVKLTRASAARLRAALVAGAPLDVRSTQPGVSGLRLEWTGELA